MTLMTEYYWTCIQCATKTSWVKIYINSDAQLVANWRCVSCKKDICLIVSIPEKQQLTDQDLQLLTDMKKGIENGQYSDVQFLLSPPAG